MIKCKSVTSVKIFGILAEDNEKKGSGNPEGNKTDYFDFNRVQECLQGGLVTTEMRLVHPSNGSSEHNVTRFKLQKF